MSGETESITEDLLLKRHRQERKDLQGKIQSLKKTATKGDKKKKKEIADAVLKLEQELSEKQSRELNATEVCDINSTEVNTENSDEVNEEENVESQRVSRAQRRRNKRVTEDAEREKRISEQEEKNKHGPRFIELNSIKESLQNIGLQIYNIPADGNCLYCAVNHQLEVTGREAMTIKSLRKLTAEFLRDNKEEFLPFMCNDSEEPVNEEHFEEYCKEVANTKLWGGQLELRALSNILKCPIKVIQASGPSTLQGESYSGNPLVLTYHRHLYRLGEHYNSTIALLEEITNES